jgi:hypothetical protein
MNVGWHFKVIFTKAHVQMTIFTNAVLWSTMYMLVFIRAVLQKLETSTGAIRMITNIFSVKLYFAS